MAILLLVLVASSRSVAGTVDTIQAIPIPTQLHWYNVSRPLTMSALRGRAVLLDFFSPGCINCIHMLPLEARLKRHFGPRLVIVGVDSPKYLGSDSGAAVESFIARQHVRHPVVLDHHSQLWNAYGVAAWPTLILIGPAGQRKGRFVGDRYNFHDLAGPIAATLAQAPSRAQALQPLPLAPLPPPQAVFSAPAGLAVSDTLVAIADTGHDRVVLVTRTGKLRAAVGAARCGHPALFNHPHGLAFHHGSLYVADTGGNRILRIDLQTLQVTTVAGNGERGISLAAPSRAHAAALNSPWGLAWHADMLYVSMAGDHQIWRYDPRTQLIGPWAGTGGEGLRDGTRQNAAFAQPSGLAVHAGVLYDADAESSSIRAVKLGSDSGSPRLVRTLVGAARGLFNFGMRDGEAYRALLQHPQDVAYANGRLYIADTFNNAIRVLDLKHQRVGTVARVHRPLAIAALAPDTLLVASNDHVEALQLPHGTLTPWPIVGLSANRSSRRCPDARLIQ